MSDKNEIIRSAAAQVAENYRKSDILMYGDALRLPSRTAVIEIIRDFQKILFPAYYGDRDLLKLPPEQYSALLMGHVYDKLLRQTVREILRVTARRRAGTRTPACSTSSSIASRTSCILRKCR